MAAVLLEFLDPEAPSEFTAPPFLWGDPSTVEERLGEAVDDLETERRTLHSPALSPAHAVEQTASGGGPFAALSERAPEADRAAVRERCREVVADWFDEERDAVALPYLLTTATVA